MLISKSSVLNLRGILMTLVAALAIGVSGSAAKAMPTAAAVIFQDYQDAASSRWNSMFFNLGLMQQRLSGQLVQGIANGKSYPQLVKMVDAAVKSGVKEIRTAVKDIHKMSKQARKALTNAGAPSAYIAQTYDNDQYVDGFAGQASSLLQQYWMQLLNSLLP